MDAHERELLDGAQVMARSIGEKLPAGVGFALLVFDLGAGGCMTYTSNARREDMVHALRELLMQLEATRHAEASVGPASAADCPCCYDDLRSERATDTALVAAFLSGMVAAYADVPLPHALCARHGRIGTEAASFLAATHHGSGHG